MRVGTTLAQRLTEIGSDEIWILDMEILDMEFSCNPKQSL